jgi:hypothetical protein
MVMVRSLPDIFVRGRDHCRNLLRGLYGQSDGTGKGCGRGRRDGTSGMRAGKERRKTP